MAVLFALLEEFGVGSAVTQTGDILLVVAVPCHVFLLPSSKVGKSDLLLLMSLTAKVSGRRLMVN